MGGHDAAEHGGHGDAQLPGGGEDLVRVVDPGAGVDPRLVVDAGELVGVAAGQVHGVAGMVDQIAVPQLVVQGRILQAAQGIAHGDGQVVAQPQVFGHQGGEAGHGTVAVGGGVEALVGDVLAPVENAVGAALDLLPVHGDQHTGIRQNQGRSFHGDHPEPEKLPAETGDDGGKAPVGALHRLLQQVWVHLLAHGHGKAVGVGMPPAHERQIEDGGIVNGVGCLFHRHLVKKLSVITDILYNES